WQHTGLEAYTCGQPATGHAAPTAQRLDHVEQDVTTHRIHRSPPALLEHRPLAALLQLFAADDLVSTQATQELGLFGLAGRGSNAIAKLLEQNDRDAADAARSASDQHGAR